MTMLSSKISIVRNRAHLLAASSVAAASVAAAYISQRNGEEEVVSQKDAVKNSSGSNGAHGGLSGLWNVDATVSFQNAGSILSHASFIPPGNNSNYCSCESLLPSYNRQQTMRMFNNSSSKVTLESRYKIDWDQPLGEGGYGSVYMCTDRKTGEKRALKMIPKEYTDDESFQREIDALLKVRDSGSHPNICRLKENFEQRGYYYLVIDLISGGEMFDQLCDNGPYSEADAARLMMETASALAFLHGVGLVHADLKPENLMLSTRNKTDSVIKLVDFGCSEYYKGNIDARQIRDNTFTTPAYSPSEAFGKWKGPLQPSFDMWSMGCIIYIMLTGVHPFDPDGTSTNEEMEERIKKGPPPIRNSPITAHLSDSAIDLIERLMNKSPRRRMTAMQMLDHPWVKGETAKKDKIKHSDKKLKGFQRFKSRLEAKVFSDWISGATSDAAKKTSLIERAFKSLDTHGKGYVTTSDLNKNLTRKGEKPADEEDDEDDPLSLSGFSDLLSDKMANKYYPEGYRIYKEGSKGDAVYFINSGTVEVSTKAGFKTTLSQGQFFGEGALLGTGNGRRSAAISCLTPVHAVRISKLYFDKYMKSGGSEINLLLREQDRARDRDRAQKILRLQKNLLERDLSNGDVLFSYGSDGTSLYIVEDGEVAIKGETGKHILTIRKGEMCGEHALVTGLPRNTTALCSSNTCKVYELAAKDFRKLYNSSPSMKQSFREVCFRRDFQKAFAKKFGKDFGNSDDELREAFDAADLDKSGAIDLEEIKALLKLIYPHLPEDDPLFTDALNTMDIDGDKSVSWEEFKKVFA